MRKQGTGKISQNININSKFITPINVDTPVQGHVDMGYFASSLTTFIDAGGDIFFPVNLSNVDTIFTYSQVQPAGNTIFTNVQTEPTVILKYIGEDPGREGLLETPKRVRKAFKEYFKGYQEDPYKILSKTFGDVDGYNDIVIQKNISVQSHCEHHMAPIIGIAHVAYIPNERVVGLSKLARVVEAFSK